MQSEIIPTQKDKYCMISLVHGLQSSQTQRSREENGSCQRQCGERGNEETLVKGSKVAVLQSE